LLKNNLVLNINSANESEINKTLAMCNINILQFDCEIDFSVLKKYKKNVQGKSLTFLEIIGSCEVKDIPLTFLFLPVEHTPVGR
jgi:hypothetical protein